MARLTKILQKDRNLILSPWREEKTTMLHRFERIKVFKSDPHDKHCFGSVWCWLNQGNDLRIYIYNKYVDRSDKPTFKQAKEMVDKQLINMGFVFLSEREYNLL